jgi:hypothetical protein
MTAYIRPKPHRFKKVFKTEKEEVVLAQLVSSVKKEAADGPE